jgi:hypothetical protein
MRLYFKLFPHFNIMLENEVLKEFLARDGK